MAVYLKKVSANRFEVIYPMGYNGSAPHTPLWQHQIYRRDYVQADKIRFGTPWYHMGYYLSGYLNIAAGNYTAYARSAWTRTGFASSLTGIGSNDGLFGVVPTEYYYTTTAGETASLAITVTQNPSLIVMSMRFANTYLVTDSTRIVLTNSAGQQIPLTGRIWMWDPTLNLSSGILYNSYVDNVNCIGPNGMLRFGGSYSGSQNVYIELARDLPPDTYTLAVTHYTTNKTTIGRVVVIGQDKTSNPKTGWQYQREDTIVTDNATLPGPLHMYANQSQDFLIMSASNWTGGPSHGYTSQPSAVITCDGVVFDFDAAEVGTYGPYTTVDVDLVDYYHNQASLTNGAGYSFTPGNNRITLTGGTLASAHVYDILTLGTSIQGLNGTAYYRIIGIGADYVDVYPTPANAEDGVGVAWDIGYNAFAAVSIKYRHLGTKLTVSGSGEFLDANNYLMLMAQFARNSASNRYPVTTGTLNPYQPTKIYVKTSNDEIKSWAFLSSATANLGILAKAYMLEFGHFEFACRAMQRMLVFELPYANWTGLNYTDAANGCKVTHATSGGSDYKVYTYPLAGGTQSTPVAKLAEATFTFEWSQYFAEPVKVLSDADLIVSGSGSGNFIEA